MTGPSSCWEDQGLAMCTDKSRCRVFGPDFSQKALKKTLGRGETRDGRERREAVPETVQATFDGQAWKGEADAGSLFMIIHLRLLFGGWRGRESREAFAEGSWAEESEGRDETG